MFCRTDTTSNARAFPLVAGAVAVCAQAIGSAVGAAAIAATNTVSRIPGEQAQDIIMVPTILTAKSSCWHFSCLRRPSRRQNNFWEIPQQIRDVKPPNRLQIANRQYPCALSHEK
jgi:hypothetical protein